MVKERSVKMVDQRTELGPTSEQPIRRVGEIEFKMPPSIKQRYQGEAFNLNRGISIPEKNDAGRHHLANRLGRTLRIEDPDKPSGWACIYGDLDQLKVVNDRFGRQKGDAYITWGVTTALQTVDQNVNLPTNAFMVPMRKGEAADEIVMWFYGIGPKEIKKLRELVDRGQFPTEEIDMEEADGSRFPFSSSYGIVTSEDTQTVKVEKVIGGRTVTEEVPLQELIATTKKYVAEEPSRIPWDLFNTVEQTAGNYATEEKIAKDLIRIPIDQLFQANHLDEFIGLMTSDFGGGRVSYEVMEILLKLQSLKTISAVAPDLYQTMLEKIGVKPEDIESKIQNASSTRERTEILVGIFQDLFGKVED